MDNSNLKFSEQAAVLGMLVPVSQSAATVTSTWVPAANFHRIAAVLQTGVMATGSTLDAKLQQATDASGTSAKDITGKAITQMVAASGGSKEITIECRTGELDLTNGFGYVGLVVTVGTAASLLSALLYGIGPRFAPASALNHTGTVQQV